MRLVTALFSLFVLVNSALVSLRADVEPEEGAPMFFARDLVPPELLRTDFYTVAPMVEVHGFGYQFRVESGGRDYVVRGVDELYKLLHELEVIQELAKIGQGEAFASSLTSSLSSPVVTTFGIAKRPVSSVAGLPSGIGRYLGGKLYQVGRGSSKAVTTIRSMTDGEKEDASEAEEEQEKVSSARKLSRKHLGHDSAKRRWAKQLEVDPYSDNVVLQDALARIAWASTLGNLAGDFAVPSSEVFSYAGKARQLVWDKPAYQLERQLVANLKKCGVPKELWKEFRDTRVYSLTEKTHLGLDFLRLKRSGGVPFLVAFSLQAKSAEDAALFVRTVAVMVKYNDEVSELQSISEKRGLLYLTSKNGYDLYPLAVDYLFWTPLVSDALLSEELVADKREIWVTGIVSPIAKLRLRHHGWVVFDQVGLKR